MSSTAAAASSLARPALASRPARAARRASARGVASAAARCAAARDESADESSSASASVSRRAAIGAALLLGTALDVDAARAFERPPPGFRPFNDTIDGYKLFRPEDWIEVKGSGNDVFFRNPARAEENMFVSISSPSSTKFDTVRDLGTPEDVAKKVLDQYLTEFMSTRIGVRRESSVVSAAERVETGLDGAEQIFYDVRLRIASYATKNQYGLTEADRPQTLEWDRVLASSLGVANKRLYELRVQTAAEDAADAEPSFEIVRRSFKPFEVDQSNLSFPLF